MPLPDACPLAPGLFDDLIESLGREEDDDEESGMLKETLQLFVDQFSSGVLDLNVTGIEHRTRTQLELRVSRGDLTEMVADVTVLTIDLAKEVSAQAYAPLDGLEEDYVIPWLAGVSHWLEDDHPDSPCAAALRRYFEDAA